MANELTGEKGKVDRTVKRINGKEGRKERKKERKKE
jgi:hypothetical protein